jgi:hypothetical protein
MRAGFSLRRWPSPHQRPGDVISFGFSILLRVQVQHFHDFLGPPELAACLMGAHLLPHQQHLRVYQLYLANVLVAIFFEVKVHHGVYPASACRLPKSVFRPANTDALLDAARYPGVAEFRTQVLQQAHRANHRRKVLALEVTGGQPPMSKDHRPFIGQS